MSEARVTLAIVDGIAHLTFDHLRRMLAEVAAQPETRAEKRAPRLTEE
jgi:hypothetical protein